jgi:small subunit ribosomal protein S9
MADAKEKYYYGRGRRKEASARVRVYLAKGASTVNGKPFDEYFKDNETIINEILQPLKLTGNFEKSHFTVVVEGGGISGQAEAIRLGLSRAIVEYDENAKSTLRKAGLLTRDPREKERKKYGLKRARKAPQFSKR